MELPLISELQYNTLGDYKELARLFSYEEIAPRLKHSDRVKLQDIYSQWTGEPPADIYCNECVNELFSRLMKEVTRFELSKNVN